MNSKRIPVDKRPQLVLTTDLLPFERTLPHSNDGFFRYQVSKKKNIPTLVNLINSDSKVKIPFSYAYSRNNYKTRNVSIIHPLEQLRFIDFYEKYDNLLIHFCKRSKFSLRHITSKVKSVIAKEDSIGLLHPPKYFKYGPYKLLHEFYTSFEYIRLEKTFKYQLKADISKCFDSIYTHSISWAVSNKIHAKRNLNASSFDELFDNLMQSANYKETNGIIIGPEISRIFAELILQDIDVSIEKDLEKKGYKYSIDYKIRRYVDDYMIFCNSSEVAELIYSVIEDKISIYKMSLNESKKELMNAPFMSAISVAKIEISVIINNFFEQFKKIPTQEEGGAAKRLSISSIKKTTRPYDISMRFIDQVKGVVDQRKINLSDVSRFAVSIIRNRIFELLKLDEIFDSLNQQENKNLTNFVCINVNILLYFISLDTVVNNIFKVMQVADRISDFYIKNKIPSLNFINLQFANEIKFAIRLHKHKEGVNSIELIQMLLCLKILGEENQFSETELLKIIGDSSLNYWGVTGLLYYVGRSKNYDKLKNLIHEDVLNKLSLVESLTYSEEYCLFYDYIKCPFVPVLHKINLINKVGRNYDMSLNTNEARSIINYIKKYNWFFAWNKSIRKLLTLQRLNPVY